MNHHVWREFTESFSNQFSVYTPDLPGFGQSKILPPGFSLADVAGVLNEWITAEDISDAILVGHSLGGYVALEMIRQNPHTFRGLVLFHSTSFADSQEKKDSRSKVLQFIDDHGVLAFTSNFIEPLFHNPQHPAIAHVKALCVEADQEAVKGYTQAMRDRSDNTMVVQEFGKPVLLLGGEYDKSITPESLHEQAGLNEKISLKILAGAAHMGMFEKKDEAVRSLLDFLSQYITPKS